MEINKENKKGILIPDISLPYLKHLEDNTIREALLIRTPQKPLKDKIPEEALKLLTWKIHKTQFKDNMMIVFPYL